MSDTFCRIITTDCSESTAAQVLSFIKNALAQLNIQDIEFSPIQPYWKSKEQGEITCRFSSSRTPAEIRSLLADRWVSETADSRQSKIYCPVITFLWVSH